MKTSESGRVVFGTVPPGVTCTKRSAAYVVISGGDGRVAAMRAAEQGTRCFWLPGGGTHPGETPEATVVREVREELGRLIKLTGRIGEAIQFFYAADDECWYEMIATFLRADFEGTPLGPGEHEFCWVDGRDQHELFFHASHAWAASQACGRTPAT